MSESGWIICERTGCWAAALRVGAARQAATFGREPRIYEVRSLDELSERLENRPLSLTFLEVRLSNFGKLLSWLADHSRRFPRERFVALVDQSLRIAASPETEHPTNDALDVFGALLEAGAAEVADSPRRLRHVFALAKTHGAMERRASRQPDPGQSITDWAWSQLPWQTSRE
jgi:hypothetical protein